MSKQASAYFVESIPLGMDDISNYPGVVATADALIQLTVAATATIDLTAMYWALQPNTKSKDESGWDKAKLISEFGADKGIALYEALSDAAERGVKLRIIESPGFDADSVPESKLLKQAHPKAVCIRQINMEDWYGSGIMHQKVWVFDHASVYIGSANMDWKSLTQVKEIGIIVEQSIPVATEVQQYFDTWWQFAGMDAMDNTTQVFDDRFQTERTVPAWSELVPADKRATNPLAKKAYKTSNSWSSPRNVSLGGETGDFALSGAPHEICVGARTFDEDMLVHTILDAQRSVCVSVMDFAPVSLYRGDYDKQSHKSMINGEVASPVWWPALIDALLHVIVTKKVTARLLVSQWAHTSDFISPFLKALQQSADAASANRMMQAGVLEIRRFEVPGWQHTGPIRKKGAVPEYPGHTRVNHTKYIVTDRHINIGTSNMTWDYFSGTAGSSFNATHPGLVKGLQNIFDRDWNSIYALPCNDQTDIQQ